MKNLEESLLRKLYIIEQRTPYQIGEYLDCDHKTVRRYLRMYSIPLRSSSQYNYLCRKTHESPSKNQLKSPVAIAAHTAYLCEGWHTENTSRLHFCNTDPMLIDLFIKSLKEIYKVRTLRLYIQCESQDTSKVLSAKYPEAVVQVTKARKTPIVIVRAGGKVLAEEFLRNAYSIVKEII